jgi:N-acetylglutamate synthase-like GNAT family acetyltransferase
MKIRKFQDKDARKLSYLIRRALNEVNIKDYPKSVVARLSKYNAPSKLIERSRRRDIYVIVDDDRIRGTASLENNNVFSVFVDPTYHGKGMGQRLMKYVERAAKKRGIDRLRLNSSLTALGFYEKLGYKKIKEVFNKSAGHQIIMEKKL